MGDLGSLIGLYEQRMSKENFLIFLKSTQLYCSTLQMSVVIATTHIKL